MTTDEAITAIPTGWRIYTIDMSIIDRAAVMLRQINHIGYVTGIASTLTDAIAAASAKAKWHHRGWTIEPSYIGYEASHLDFDADCVDGEWQGNGLHVHAMTVEDVRAQIDEKEDGR